MIIDGTIPSTLCYSDGLFVNVENTNIHCYTGCLESVSVIVQGASSSCHNGSVTAQLIYICTSVLSIMCIATAYYWYSTKRKSISSHKSYATYWSWVVTVWGKLCYFPKQLASYYSKSKRILLISFIKLLLVVAISLSADTYWTYCMRGGYAVLTRCTSNELTNCKCSVILMR